MQTTLDSILGGAVNIYQPSDGYRVAIDTIFLAAAVAAHSGEKLLDVGGGVGAASLCIAHRVPGCFITIIEKQENIADLAQKNAEINNMANRITIIKNSIENFSNGGFDHVFSNPPFFNKNAIRLPKSELAQESICENSSGIEFWINFCIKNLNQNGSLTLIYPADKIDVIFKCLAGKIGKIRVLPLWPKKGSPAKRVIISGLKSSHGETKILPGIVLHENGYYTEDATNVLEKGFSLNM